MGNVKPFGHSSSSKSNGSTGQHQENGKDISNGILTLPSSTSREEVLDLLVAGFGPAALAIAIAMYDALEGTRGQQFYNLSRVPEVHFLEKQDTFAWHSGMLLEGTKMQISFIKDLATLRNPRSKFSFLSYLHSQERLIQFANLDTFLPTRLEFHDYLKWAAEHFTDVVSYGQEVLDISPNVEANEVKHFDVRSRNTHTGRISTLKARHVVIAIGGKPSIPKLFRTVEPSPRLIHSSDYARKVSELLPNANAVYKIAVLGSGQSAAEVFDNLQSRYPHSRTYLVSRGSTLRPSDDSPFVNEIFDPARIQQFFEASAEERHSINSANRNTNYGVVRIGLLEKIYETMYLQRLRHKDEEQWPHKILTNATVSRVSIDHSDKVNLEISWSAAEGAKTWRHETFEFDMVVLATGYLRNSYKDLLRPMRESNSEASQGWTIGRDYRLQFDGLNISENAGIWLQGCNEDTHGLSDTLLSGLAVRGGEVVTSIFETHTHRHGE